ncbi:MAG: ROK family protein [Chitinophagales bacterium]
MQKTEILGIDIGGGGIKAAIVDIQTGAWRTKKSDWFTMEMLEKDTFPDGLDKDNLWYEIQTPREPKLTPKQIREIFEDIVKHYKWKGLIGLGFPAIVQNGIVRSASNIHNKWLDVHLPTFLSKNLPDVAIAAMNDTDAAGIGEMTFGTGKGKEGSVLVLTVGTGIGSALFIDGQLVPNTEFGHFFMKVDKKLYGKDCVLAEDFASSYTRKKAELSWEEWADKRLKEYLRCVQRLLSPESVIIGGGASKDVRFNQYKPFLKDTDFDKLYAHKHKTEGRAKLEMEILPAKLRNYAGIIGAAVGAKSLGDLQTITKEV